MIKTFSLVLALSIVSVSPVIATENVKNKDNLRYLQERYNYMDNILNKTKLHYDIKIDNLRSSAAFDKVIKSEERDKNKQIQVINKERSKIKLLINSNINTAEDFLFVNTGIANTGHRFSRKEYWIKKYLNKDLGLFEKYCKRDYLNISKEIEKVNTKFRLTKKKVVSPNCAFVSQHLNNAVLKSYPKFIKNFKHYIVENTVVSTFPYSRQFNENSDITDLTYILLPFVLNQNASDAYFHKYMVSKLGSQEKVSYQLENPIVRFYLKYLQESFLSTIKEKISDYEDTKCCLEVNKSGAEGEKEYQEASMAYKESIIQLKEIKEYLNKNTLKSFSKDGIFYLPLVNKETREIEDTKVSLKAKMDIFYQDLESQLKRK